MFFTLADLEKWRTKKEMRDFYNAIYRKTKLNRYLIEQARLRKEEYKEFFEEYCPLMFFCELYYKDEDIRCLYVGRETQLNSFTQKYDGEVQHDGNITRIEITRPINGKYTHNQAFEINKQGKFLSPVFDVEEEKERNFKRVYKAADKKAHKRYDDVFLIITIPTEDLPVSPTNISWEDVVEEIVQGLKNIEYTAERVFLLFEPLEINGKRFDGLIKVIK